MKPLALGIQQWTSSWNVLWFPPLSLFFLLIDFALEGWKMMKEIVTTRWEGLRKQKRSNKWLVKRYRYHFVVSSPF